MKTFNICVTDKRQVLALNAKILLDIKCYDHVLSKNGDSCINP